MVSQHVANVPRPKGRPGSSPGPTATMRAWHMGCAPVFQADETGSSPVARSKLRQVDEVFLASPGGKGTALSRLDITGSNPVARTIHPSPIGRAPVLWYRPTWFDSKRVNQPGVAQLARAPVSYAGGRLFDAGHRDQIAGLAQWESGRLWTSVRVGSIPSAGARYIGVAQW